MQLVIKALETRKRGNAETRTHCCGHKSVSDFVQKHFVSATNVSQFAQRGNTTFILCPARLPRKHHEQKCINNNVSSFAGSPFLEAPSNYRAR